MFDPLRTSAQAVVSRVFETMFFIALDSVEELPQESGSSGTPSAIVRGEIGFEGPYRGRLILDLPLELVQTMASNLLGGGERPVPESEAADVVKELCNVICGNLSSQLDKEQVWTLTIPVARQIGSEQGDEKTGPGWVGIDFNAEGYRVKLRIEVNGPTHPQVGG